MIFHGLPVALAALRTEPAFADGAWTIRGNDYGQLAIPSGLVELYAAFAKDYYERELPLRSIHAILTGVPLGDALVATIAPDRNRVDLAEIGY